MLRHVDRSALYRERAARARQVLADVKVPEARETLVNLAARYDQAANEIERGRGAPEVGRSS